MISRQRGIALVLVALVATSLLLMAGIGGDVGMVLTQRTRMQTAADAAALAGAGALSGGNAAAVAAALTYAAKNGFTLDPGEVSIDAQTVTVQFVREQGLALGGLLSERAVDVPVTAVAERMIRSYGLRPFGLPDLDLVPGLTYVLKVAPTPVKGNFQALDFDAAGAKGFLDGIQYGSTHTYRVGDFVNTETGNMNGPTRTGVEFVLASGATQVVIPVISPQLYAGANGKSLVRIEAFAVFELIAVSGRAEVIGRLVEVTSESEATGTVVGSRLIL